LLSFIDKILISLPILMPLPLISMPDTSQPHTFQPHIPQTHIARFDPSPALLTLEQVCKSFGATPVLQNISLQLQPGELLTLLGSSGCGKTTLLRLIAGFERPDGGHLDLAGQRLAGQGRWVAPERRGIGMVFQDYALFPHLTVAQNIGFGLKRAGRFKRFKRPSRPAPSHPAPSRLEAGFARGEDSRGDHLGDPIGSNLPESVIHQMLHLVGLAGLAERYPHELSGGQQQRVALARALAPNPSLILLDEPLSNLDVQTRLYLRQEIREILKQTGTSAIFVTHDQEEAASISDRIAVMRQGQLEQIDTPEALYQNPRTRFVAEFISQANFLPAQRAGRHWDTPIGAIARSVGSNAPESSLEQAPAQLLGDRVELMVRPEDMQLRLNPEGNILVRDRQFLGREYRYFLISDQGYAFQAISPNQIDPGHRVTCWVESHQVKAF
jgi:iron(III) transport system ATP-binding protein